jgi:CubicO group peptidase (beta-lactamase class C family)
VAGCAPTSGTPTGNAAAIQSILTAQLKASGLNAIIFGSSLGGSPLLTTALGNSTPGVPATTAMHFRVGMPAELLETTLLLELVDRKQIGLTDLASKWFPTYPYATLATVRMLGASSTGFGDYVYGHGVPSRGIPSFADLVDRYPYRRFPASELILRSQEPFQEPKFDDPGKNWDYSHTNYVMLGTIIEDVTKLSYGVAVRHYVTAPLGLGDTVFSIEPPIAAPVLHAFTTERGKYEDSTGWSPSWTSYSGALNSNVCDLVALEHALGTGQLLSPQSRAEITAPTNVGLGKNAPSLYFGFGTIVNHGWIVSLGNFFGWHTAAAYYAPQDITLAITVSEGPNAKDPGNVNKRILEKITRLLTPSAPIALP